MRVLHDHRRRGGQRCSAPATKWAISGIERAVGVVDDVELCGLVGAEGAALVGHVLLPAGHDQRAGHRTRSAIWLAIVPDGTKSASGLPTLGEHLLQAVDRIVAEAVVADLGLGHGAAWPPSAGSRCRCAGPRRREQRAELGHRRHGTVARHGCKRSCRALDLATDAAQRAADLLLDGFEQACHRRDQVDRHRHGVGDGPGVRAAHRVDVAAARPDDGLVGEEGSACREPAACAG